jgi:hypothetical protein
LRTRNKKNQGEQVDFELRFKAPFESTSKAYTAVISVNEPKVKWGFYGSMDYPLIYCCLYANGEDWE